MKALSRAAVGAPAALAVRGAIDRQTTDGSAPPARPILRAAILATASGLLVFLLFQGLLVAYNVHVVHDAIGRGLVDGYPSTFRSFPLRLLTALIEGGLGYVVFALVGIAIASRGHRIMFLLPAAIYVLLPVVIGYLGYAHLPQAIGTQWRIECFSTTFTCSGPWFGHPWFGPLIDLALVLVPGWIVATRVPARRWPVVVDPPAIAAILASCALVALATWTDTVISPGRELSPAIAAGSAGLALGTARPWWPWLHVLFGSLFAGALVGFVVLLIAPTPSYGMLDVLRYYLEPTLPIVVAGLLASAWQPFAWLLRELDERPLHLLVAVNLLNVVDAVMTAVVVGSGGAVEANPLVRFGGLPAKVILVGVLTILLYRRRPSALVWPAAALLWVACYHVSGILVNGWRA